MEKELTYIEGQPFYYQIGEVSTIIPWWRPTYERICNFLIQDEVIEIFNKFEDVEIIGNCLWDFDVTWDVDIRLILPNHVPRDWNLVEDYINKLNHLALNEWRLLLDVGVTCDYHRLPTKKEILSKYYKTEDTEGYKVSVDESWIAKIAYTKKVINDQMFEYDIRTSNNYFTEGLNDRFLTVYQPNYHKNKIINKIINSKKEILENSIRVEDFLAMGEEEFKKFQNY